MSKGNKKDNVIPLRPNVELDEDRELHSILDAGKALTSEHDVSRIMSMILDKAMENTGADGGSIYLMERVKQDTYGGARDQFKYVLNFLKSSNKDFQTKDSNFKLELNNESIAGFVAVNGQTVRISDCYKITKNVPYKFNSSFDEKTGYKTKSILAVPIMTTKGKVIGVVQLVNKLKAFRRKSDQVKAFPHNIPPAKSVTSFTEYDEKLMEAFASHAAVALENAKLTEDIAKLFESFVRASVTAIEARDPTTSGHSDRVAELTCGFAERVDNLKSGQFSGIRFSTEQMKELRYAALLHDFGKIGVRENVLLKAKKLFPNEMETILLRLETLRSKNEAKQWKQAAEEMVQIAKKGDPEDLDGHLGKTLWRVDSFVRKLEDIRKGIITANEPQVLDKDFNIKDLISWIDNVSQDMGQVIVTPEERKRLSIARGTLGEDERREIESHVSYTYEFLSQIAWTDDLSGIPDIAHAHHEKLDGTGYPRRLTANEIPIQARMMTISDIYDALTAMDRPYKRAVTAERALEILHLEAGEGKLDPALLEIFVGAEIFKVTANFKKKKAS